MTGRHTRLTALTMCSAETATPNAGQESKVQMMSS